ncbi:MAG TPA: CopD family protein [Terriglobia bacterium]|nr:CopD family protein [Terriglobia bacterium]
MNSGVAWALVFHILGIVFWMGGLLVTTQVLAMHVDEESPESRATLAHLETKLLKGVTHPGAAITVLAGIVVVVLQPDYLHQHWLHAKLALVAILIALDLIVYFRTRAFHAGRLDLQRRECKLLHGAISLVFLGILVLVTIKPF